MIRGFAKLTHFGGRDTRGQFWPYAAVAFALYILLGNAFLVPIALPMMVSGEVSSTSFMSMAKWFILVSVLAFVFLVALLAAAVTRRLHDTGRSGLWGLLPLPFVAYSVVAFVRLISTFTTFDGRPPDIGLFFSTFLSNALYM